MDVGWDVKEQIWEGFTEEVAPDLGLRGWLGFQKLLIGGKDMLRGRNSMSKN